jgi:hypothetical protein
MKFVVLILLSSCAFVHRHYVGDINSHAVLNGTRFELLFSKNGIDASEGARYVSVFSTNNKTSASADQWADIIALFQMGPRTGNPMFGSRMTRTIHKKLSTVCNNQPISGLTILRETNKYPVVSGEIIKVSGYCVLPKESL